MTNYDPSSFRGLLKLEGSSIAGFPSVMLVPKCSIHQGAVSLGFRAVLAKIIGAYDPRSNRTAIICKVTAVHETTQNIHLHETSWASNPPIIGPMAGPRRGPRVYKTTALPHFSAWPQVTHHTAAYS